MGKISANNEENLRAALEVLRELFNCETGDPSLAHLELPRAVGRRGWIACIYMHWDME